MSEAPSRPDFAALFEKARTVEIATVAGVPLFRSGRRLRGQCPICGASKGKRSDGAFSVEPRLGVWTCWGACGRGGDVVDLERELRGGSLVEAAERLAGPAPKTFAPASGREPRPAPDPARPGFGDAVGASIWRDSAPAPGTLVERYLRGRGLDGPVLAAALRRLRYAWRAPWTVRADGSVPVWSAAMVAHVRTPAGPTGGVHVTYLGADGRKAALTPAKRMWGRQGAGEGDDARPGGVWLIGPAGAGPLVVGEGIESTLSAAQLVAAERGGPVRAVAALSLGALQGGWLADRFGRRDPQIVAGDPERPAFTWPAPDGEPEGWPEVLAAVDRDMKPIEIKTRRVTGGTWRRRLDSDERARICAALAEQAWRRAGASRVRAIAPGAGRDFNDELFARGGA